MNATQEQKDELVRAAGYLVTAIYALQDSGLCTFGTRPNGYTKILNAIQTQAGALNAKIDNL